MKCTRLLETQLFGDVADTRLALTQLFERHPTAYFVLDLLIGAALALEFAAEGTGAQVLFEGKGLQGRPLAVMAVAQALVHL
ncbi:hypothetical protein D3C78_1628810 [compost metagenome]